MYHTLPYACGGMFGRLDIIYHTHVSGDALPFKALALGRETQQSINHSTNSIFLH
jgi:hypothetical protein